MSKATKNRRKIAVQKIRTVPGTGGTAACEATKVEPERKTLAEWEEGPCKREVVLHLRRFANQVLEAAERTAVSRAFSDGRWLRTDGLDTIIESRMAVLGIYPADPDAYVS